MFVSCKSKWKKKYKTLFAANEKPTLEVPTTAENSRAAENSRTAESLAASSPSSVTIQPGTKQKKGILSSLKKKFYKRWKLIKLIYSTIFKSGGEREKKSFPTSKWMNVHKEWIIFMQKIFFSFHFSVTLEN